MNLMSGGVHPALAPTSYRHLLGVPATDDFILAIDKVTLVQTAASAGSSKQDPRWGCQSLCLFALALFEAIFFVNTNWLDRLIVSVFCGPLDDPTRASLRTTDCCHMDATMT